MSGDWNSGTVQRLFPRSSPTTVKPTAASSFAMIAPMKPTPTTTTSAALSFSVISPPLLDLHRVVTRAAFYAGRVAIHLDPVLIYQLVVVSVWSRKSQHLPPNHIL